MTSAVLMAGNIAAVLATMGAARPASSPRSPTQGPLKSATVTTGESGEGQGEGETAKEQREKAKDERAEPGTRDGAGPQAGRRADVLYLRFDEADVDGTIIKASHVTATYGEYEITGSRLEGDLSEDLLFTGEPALTYRGQTLRGDAIRFNARTKVYRIENLRTALTPDFLQNRAVSPLFLAGGTIEGREGEPIVGTRSTATSCDRPQPHYLLEAQNIEVAPGKRLTLRRAALSLYGRRVVVLPTVVVPLDRRLPRGGYQPQVGRSLEEGWFAKTGFNYLLAPRAPGMYRVDLMEKKGIGLGVEQAWNAARVNGEAALYGIPLGGQGSNVSARLRSRIALSAAGALELGYETRRNDYRTLPDTTDESYRFGYSLRGSSSETALSLNSRSNRSGAYHSDSSAANLAQRISLGRSGSVLFNADYSRYGSGSQGTASQTNQQLATRLQGDYRAPNYVLQVAANRSVPIGSQSGQSYFGGVERLPEVTLSQYRFMRGALSKLPLSFAVGAGKFSEGASSGGSASKTVTERVTAGFDISSSRFALSSSTDADVSAGFTQYLYAEGAAQFVLRGNSSFVQRWGGKSGLSVRHNYQQPHGGTPFRFDQQGKYHTVTADVGFLDDQRLQLTARAGYDLARPDYSGVKQPWQTISANLYVRPVDWFRLRSLLTYDPNAGEFVSITSDMRVRGRNDFALDLVSRYDPRTHRFGQVNAYLNLPILPTWRAIVLAQYNGYLSRFESRNIQIVHDMHCMEASLTLIDNPYGWRADRQVMFQIRIKAFPAFQQFGTGLYGQALDTSVGERF